MSLFHRIRRLLLHARQPRVQLPTNDPAPVPDLASRLAAAQSASFYDEAYFDKPKDVNSESGYAGYTSQEPGVAAAVHIVATYFNPTLVLDVGCAKGFVVDGLRQRGIDAWGIDFSRYAVETAPPRVRNYVAVGDVTAIQHPDNAFDLVICNETLEHLSADRTTQAIAELYRVTSDKLWITSPSMGANDFGPPNGWPQGKVREDALPRYLALDDSPDPALLEDLMLDKDGFPIHGHLTIASYRWWTEQFTRQGLIRLGEIEQRINLNEPLLQMGAWNGYVLEKPRTGDGTPERAEERRAAAASVSSRRLSGEIGQEAASPWRPGETLRVATTGDAPGWLLRTPGVSLPPGWYELTLEMGLPGRRSPIDGPSEWSRIATIEVRSSGGRKIHALRTLRVGDFSADGLQAISMRFGSSGESDFEFRVWVSGICDTYAAPSLRLAAS